VTGCSEGAGTSTIAGGLATALSKVGDGKVLLVDMGDESASLHPFFEGRPIFSISDALRSNGAMCAAAENLYLASAALPLNNGESISLRAFYDLMPRFLASEFDYVVFDMPPLNRSRSALSIGRFMDKVLLVVESEKSSREAVQRSYSELKSTNVNVSAVLNKTRSYTPRWLDLNV
jgi:Mrp family chromosome partitioning ATPase